MSVNRDHHPQEENETVCLRDLPRDSFSGFFFGSQPNREWFYDREFKGRRCFMNDATEFGILWFLVMKTREKGGTILKWSLYSETSIAWQLFLFFVVGLVVFVRSLASQTKGCPTIEVSLYRISRCALFRSARRSVTDACLTAGLNSVRWSCSSSMIMKKIADRFSVAKKDRRLSSSV